MQFGCTIFGTAGELPAWSVALFNQLLTEPLSNATLCDSSQRCGASETLVQSSCEICELNESLEVCSANIILEHSMGPMGYSFMEYSFLLRFVGLNPLDDNDLMCVFLSRTPHMYELHHNTQLRNTFLGHQQSFPKHSTVAVKN